MKTMNEIADQTNPHNFRFAEGLTRLLAYIIDVVILIVISVVIALLVADKLYLINIILTKLTAFEISLCIFMSYFIILPVTKWQATLGMKLLGLKLVTLEGKKVSPLRSLVRNIIIHNGYFIVLISALFGIKANYFDIIVPALSILVFFDKHKQTFYDHLCDTYVIF